MATQVRFSDVGSQKPGKFLPLHDPGLDMQGNREPVVHGRESIETINEPAKVTLEESFQSNHEGALIERVHGVDSLGLFGAFPSRDTVRPSDRDRKEAAWICAN